LIGRERHYSVTRCSVWSLSILGYEDLKLIRHANQTGRVLISLLGLLLAVFMTFEVAHGHTGTGANAPDASTHCQLCMTAHTAVSIQPAWLTEFVLQLIGQVSIGETSCGSRVVAFTAYIRPPPVETASA
jgi:hypothetical protein